MSRKRSRGQVKNQSTQYNAYLRLKDDQDIGIQCLISMEDEVPAVDDEVPPMVPAIVPVISNDVDVETQTEIFGSIIPSHKWDDLNLFSSTSKSSNPHKRKLLLKKETFVNEGFLVKKPAIEEVNTSSSLGLPLENGVVFSSTISRVKSFLDSLNQEIITTHHRSHDGLVEHLEVLHQKGTLLISSCYVTPIRLMFSSHGKLLISTLFDTQVEMDYLNFESEMLITDVITNSLSLLSGNYVFCTGLSKEECHLMENVKGLKKYEYPFERFQSAKCLAWYIPPATAARKLISTKLYQCPNCRNLNWYIRNRKKKLEQVTLKTKLKREFVESKCKFSVLTPKSKRLRLLKNKQKRASLVLQVKKLKKRLTETSLELSKEQDKKMTDVVSEIN